MSITIEDSSPIGVGRRRVPPEAYITAYREWPVRFVDWNLGAELQTCDWTQYEMEGAIPAWSTTVGLIVDCGGKGRTPTEGVKVGSSRPRLRAKVSRSDGRCTGQRRRPGEMRWDEMSRQGWSFWKNSQSPELDFLKKGLEQIESRGFWRKNGC